MKNAPDTIKSKPSEKYIYEIRERQINEMTLCSLFKKSCQWYLSDCNFCFQTMKRSVLQILQATVTGVQRWRTVTIVSASSGRKLKMWLWLQLCLILTSRRPAVTVDVWQLPHSIRYHASWTWEMMTRTACRSNSRVTSHSVVIMLIHYILHLNTRS
jgi:hypothetical protein